MKYLSLNLTPEEAKRIYRLFAKFLHPDAPSGNAEEFKLLHSEYEQCQNNAFTAPPLNDNNFDIRMYQNVKMPFGKHENKPICDIPKSYAQWCLANIPDLTYLLRKALEWRASQVI